MSAIPPLTPYLTVSDAVAAIEFYIKAFNALPDGEPHLMPETGKIMHMRLMVNGSMIMLADDLAAMMGHPPSTPEALGGSPVTLALQFDDVQPVWDSAVAAGATVTMPLADQFWGARYGQLTDPFGHKWSLSQTLKSMSSEEIQSADDAALSKKSTLLAEEAAA